MSQYQDNPPAVINDGSVHPTGTVVVEGTTIRRQVYMVLLSGLLLLVVGATALARLSRGSSLSSSSSSSSSFLLPEEKERYYDIAFQITGTDNVADGNYGLKSQDSDDYYEYVKLNDDGTEELGSNYEGGFGGLITGFHDGMYAGPYTQYMEWTIFSGCYKYRQIVPDTINYRSTPSPELPWKVKKYCDGYDTGYTGLPRMLPLSYSVAGETPFPEDLKGQCKPCQQGLTYCIKNDGSGPVICQELCDYDLQPTTEQPPIACL